MDPPAFLFVLDFEATCDEDRKTNPIEIIEFPTVIVDVSSMSIVAEFHEYVKPVHNPILTPFCTSLTGITQDTVDQASPFPEVYKRFQAWMASLPEEMTKDPLFVTCGDWDLKTMLPTQCTVSGVPIPAYLKSWCNVKKIYGNGRGMDSMLNGLGLPLVGRHHNGLDDARNIASICIELMKRGKVCERTWIPR
eukprot:PhF_6_TR39876/c0_g1_i1/m.59287/K18418/ERI3, PINT1; ERI1 exoribonuclease 3